MTGDDIRARLRALRKELGLSQDELAQRAGVSVRTLQRFERGGKTHGETQRKIENALGDAGLPWTVEPDERLDRIEAMLAEILSLLRPRAEPHRRS